MYAHARIEHPETGEVYERGDVVPDDLPGIEELAEFGSVSEDEFDDPDPYKKSPDNAMQDALRIQAARDRYVAGEITIEQFEKEITGPVKRESSDGAEASAT